MMQPIAGYIMDVIGLKLGFGLFALAWAVITMLHGVAYNWPMLAALRGIMGFAEGSAQAGGMKAVAEWFPGEGTRLRRRLLQHRRLVRFDAGGAAGGLGHPVPQLAPGLRDRRWRGADLGGVVVPLLLLA